MKFQERHIELRSWKIGLRILNWEMSIDSQQVEDQIYQTIKFAPLDTLPIEPGPQSNFQIIALTEFGNRSAVQINMASFSHAYLDWMGASNLGTALK
jgi:hypothetical protein